VDALPAAAQAKLLRFLQSREYKPLGASRPRKADVRVLAASNARLPDLVRAGAFREDLYYRLAVVRVTLPPLRDRREDIPLLARHFLALAKEEYGRAVAGIAAPAMIRLRDHDWPGNVRELENVVRQAVVLARSAIIGVAELHLGSEPPSGDRSGMEPFKVAKSRAVAMFERTYLQQLLVRCDGNISRAAREAGKDRRALFAVLKRHGLTGRPRLEMRDADADSVRVAR
jgi:DNA-binding NtrC family response regulator